VPPLMVIETTGEGRARFNPNLYADGKVCLSLLGTFHGANAAEKWSPKDSSLYQILLSVQGLILIEVRARWVLGVGCVCVLGGVVF
jgi:baculoviral IAP repeat-containing protein 6